MNKIDLRRNKIKGFTLIEIILVVIILSIIAGFSIPNFLPLYKSLQLQNTANDLAYTMRYAQSRAVTRNILVCVEFDGIFTSYQLKEQEDPLKDPDKDELVNIPGRLGRVVHVPEEIDIKGEENKACFYPGGEMDKQHIWVCSEGKCIIVSTKEHRNMVKIFTEQKR